MMQLCKINVKGLYIPQRYICVNIDVSNCCIAAKWKNTMVGPVVSDMVWHGSNSISNIGVYGQIIGSNLHT
eukprot:6172116-Pleurochrysis_carterae.AAC.1